MQARQQMPRVEAEPVEHRARRANGNGHLEGKGIGDLLRDLSRDTSLLVRQEVELFKAEMNARIEKAQRTGAVLGVGASITWFGCMALTAAIILGLAEVMDGWVAALLVGLAYVLAGGIALAIGKKRLNEQEMAPQETMSSVKKDIRAVQEAAR